MLPFDDLSLQMLLLDLGFALLMLALGSGAGWLLSPRSASQKVSQNAKQAIEKLRELASTVAADVGLHASRMHAINTELTEAQAKGTPTERAMSQTVADIHKANEALQEQLMTAEVRLERQAIELKSHLEASRTDVLAQVKTISCNVNYATD